MLPILLALSAAVDQAGAATAPPRVCWRPLARLPALPAAIADSVTGSDRDRLWATDGAHPSVRLTPPGARPERPFDRQEFSIGGRDPKLLLHGAGFGALEVWADDRQSAMRRLIVRLADGPPPDCIRRRAADGEVLVVEARSESGASTCLAWPAAGGFGTAGRSATCAPIAVPQLVARPLAEARSILERQQLSTGEVEERLAAAAAQVVLEQRPAADSGRALASGDPVDLVVARSAAAVPEIVGLTVDRASQRLAALGLVLTARSGGSMVDPQRVAGYEVGAQSPSPGNLLETGGAVLGEVALRLPDLRARSLGETLRLLAGSGLRPAPAGIEPPAAEGARDPFSITGHRPAGGELAVYGQTVELEVGVPVPNLRGLRPAVARQRLRALALELEGADDEAAAERIRVQDPAAGTVVAPATRVRAGLGVLAPDIEGATVGEALERLRRRGLDLELGDPGAVERWRAATESHRLEEQRPSAGTLLAGGSRVAASLAVEVPNLRWQSFTRADARLRRLELSPDRPLPGAAGSLRHRVVGQRPQPGTWLRAGAPVQLVLGPGLTPDPPPPHWPWEWMAAVAALSASLLRPRPRKPPRQLRVEAETDFGRPRLTAAGGRRAEPAVRLRPSWDPGRQRLHAKGASDA